MSHLWQNPYVNVFKHFDIASWKKASKEGDVTSIMDKTQKCTVYRIRGAVPAANYIQLPQTPNQSLGLTGRYLYLLFRPLRSKFFLVHIDVVTREALVVRVSFSNMYREMHTTATWLQFPFVCRPAAKSVDAQTRNTNTDIGICAPAAPRWTLLRLDLQALLSTYAGRHFSHVKSVRLCANMLVRNIVTSSTEYVPGISLDQMKKSGRSLTSEVAMPREMAFPVAKGEKWHDHYDFIRFPTDNKNMPADAMQFAEDFNDLKVTSPKRGHLQKVRVEKAPTDGQLKNRTVTARRERGVVTELPSVGVDDNEDLCAGADNEVHVYAQRPNKISLQEERRMAKVSTDQLVGPTSFPPKKDDFETLLPDPILKLKRIVGFGGCTTKDAIWTNNGTTLVYPCHAVVVAMQANNGHQRFFIGHTDKISCLSFDGSSSLLASGQTGTQSVVRVWRFMTAECLAVFKTHVHSLHCLSFSHNASVLCGVGKDGHGKTMVVIWSTEAVTKGGQVCVIAKAHTDVDIARMRIAAFDDTRMVSCGRDNIRLWRVKSGSLRSAPVDLLSHHNMQFTDCCFEAGYAANKDPLDRIVYACSQSGYLVEVDYRKVAIQNVRRLLPINTGGTRATTQSNSGSTAINCMCVNEAFCVTGSDDGYLRLWPLDFKHVYLEAQHEGAVTAVDISSDGVKILAGTCTGNLGILDISTRAYTTVMRSHSRRILALALDPSRRHLATVSEDHTIRIWDVTTMQQLYDFTAPKECPSSIAYHPTSQSFACGFQSGVVRVFDIASTSMLAEHRQHRGRVTGVVFAPSGQFLYTSGALGTIALYDACNHYRLLRLLSNTVARGDTYGPTALAISADGRFVAFVGPTNMTISVVDAKSLDEVLRIDTTSATADNARCTLDSAVRVAFSPACSRHLLVTTTANKLLTFSAINGKIQTEVNNIHRSGCSALDVSKDGRHLVTTGDNVIKVWDYHMRLDVNFQVFIGHSEPLSGVVFTPDGLSLISTGDAIFIWDFLAHRANEPSPEGRCKVKNYYTGEDEDYSPYASVQPARHYLNSRESSPRKQVPEPMALPACYNNDVLTEAETPCKTADTAANEISAEAMSNLCAEPAVQSETSYGSKGSPRIKEVVASDASPRVHRHRWTDDNLALSLPATSSPSVTGARSRVQNGAKGSTDEIAKRPTAHKYFVSKTKLHSLAQRRYTAPPNQAGLKLKSVIGYNGNGRENMVWQPDTGIFAYTSGSIVIVEDLKAGTQKHLFGHNEEISTLALQHDCTVLASASGSRDLSPAVICLWDMHTMVCKKTLLFHKHDIACLAYSRDDRYLISVGDYRECMLAVWCTQTDQLLTTTQCASPVSAIRWDPYTCSEFVTTGESLLFWLLDETASSVALNVHQAALPAELAAREVSDELTSLVYAGDSTLFTGSTSGRVAAWDTRHNSCFLHWDADTTEIGILVSGCGRLVTGSVGGSVRLWSVVGVGELRLHGNQVDCRDGGLTMEDEMKLDGAIVSAAFDDSLDMGIVGTSGGTLWYINWAERGSIRLVSGHSTQINAIAVCGSELLATCADDGGLRVWDIVAREQMLQFQVDRQSCQCVAFSPRPVAKSAQGSEGSRLLPGVAAGYSDGTMRVFDLNKVEMGLKTQPHSGSVTAICYASDGGMLLSGSNDGAIAVTSSSTGMTLRLIADHRGAPITCIDCAPMPEDHGVVTSPQLWLAASTDRRVSVWTADWTRDFCELVDWLTFPAPAFTPDGAAIGSGQLPASFAQFSLEEADIIVYTGYGMQKNIQFYSIAQKKVVRSIALGQWASCFDLCPHMPVFAVGCNERLLKLFDYYEGSFQDFTGFDDGVSLLKFSLDGSLLFSVAGSQILVWSLTL